MLLIEAAIAHIYFIDLTRSVRMSNHSRQTIVLSPYVRRDPLDSIDTYKKCQIPVAQAISERSEGVVFLP